MNILTKYTEHLVNIRFAELDQGLAPGRPVGRQTPLKSYQQGDMKKSGDHPVGIGAPILDFLGRYFSGNKLGLAGQRFLPSRRWGL